MPYTDHIKAIVSALPESPGVYQYFNKEGKIIYVGKAKNLKRRVTSYFTGNNHTSKVNALVKNIHDLKYIVVNSETDALLLENNLIKQHQPHYNILLKDGKTYPWLCITKEPFPRVFKTRTVVKGASYYGPYSNVWVVDTIIELIKKIYPIRTCRDYLTEEGIASGKYKVCLKYHIHNCAGCCEGFQSHAEYRRMIDEIVEIVRGNSHKITEYLTKEIAKAATEYRFEEAYALKQKLDAINAYREKTVITTTHKESMDVFGYDEEDNVAYINILHINNGSVTQGYTLEIYKKLDETREEILSLAILELRNRIQSNSRECLVPFMPDNEIDGVIFTTPQKGDKKKLLDLSYQNVKQYKLDKVKQGEKLNTQQKGTALLMALQDALKLEKTPQRIECFDNSNISGDYAVAGCVVYEYAKPLKSEYRKYNIKTVTGPDDYASMREVVLRRYSRIIEEGGRLPDLIIADGGMGQMSSIREVVEGELKLNIPIAGLVKNKKHQTSELLYGNPPLTIGIKPTDPLFKFLSGIQDEVHRYAITFHRDKRSKEFMVSELDEIPGIGEKTKNELILHFKSVKRVRSAKFEEIEKVIGTHRATVIYNYFNGSVTN